MKTLRAGFTIVELLIVVVVIAILAAITIVSYNGITNQANDTAVQSDLSNFAKKVELYKVKNGWYPNFIQIVPLGIKVSKNSYTVAPSTNHNFNYCVEVENSVNIKAFALVARSTSGAIYYVTDSKPVQQFNGSWGSSGNDTCEAVFPAYTTIQRGYAPDDPAGPWRDWVGGN